MEINLTVYLVLRSVGKYGGTMLLVAFIAWALKRLGRRPIDRLRLMALGSWVAFIGQMLMTYQGGPGDYLNVFKPRWIHLVPEPDFEHTVFNWALGVHRWTILFTHVGVTGLLAMLWWKKRKAQPIAATGAPGTAAR